VIVVIDLLAADPAPVTLAPVACHLVAAFYLFGGCRASWALRHCIEESIDLECCFSLIDLALAVVPLTRALEARFMASLTDDTVTTLAEGWLHDLLAAVRLRAPFETLVLAHLHVFLNRVVRLRDLLRANDFVSELNMRANEFIKF